MLYSLRNVVNSVEEVALCREETPDSCLQVEGRDVPPPVSFCVCAFTHVQLGCAQHFPGGSDGGLGGVAEEEQLRGDSCARQREQMLRCWGLGVCPCGLWQSEGAVSIGSHHCPVALHVARSPLPQLPPAPSWVKGWKGDGCKELRDDGDPGRGGRE